MSDIESDSWNVIKTELNESADFKLVPGILATLGIPLPENVSGTDIVAAAAVRERKEHALKRVQNCWWLLDDGSEEHRGLFDQAMQEGQELAVLAIDIQRVTGVSWHLVEDLPPDLGSNLVTQIVSLKNTLRSNDLID